ncbi:hypothetical protein BC629DRAFT_1472575 [Irpex lacteus]|nr:hypothetical protein BC629DRAFT_1472575 [Irpex lacteus]
MTFLCFRAAVAGFSHSVSPAPVYNTVVATIMFHPYTLVYTVNTAYNGRTLRIPK